MPLLELVPVTASLAPEHALMLKLNEFPDVLKIASSKYDTSLVAHYTFSLASVFNKFYEKCPVVWKGVNHSRLLMVKAYLKVMNDCMKLIGMKPLKGM